MVNFSMFFGLKISILFSITEQLSCTLQGREINADDSFMAVNACIRTLQVLQTDDEFERFFKLTKTKASDQCKKPVLPRI